MIALLHGLHAGPPQLSGLAAHLKAEGHEVVLLNVPTRRGLAACIADARAQLDLARPAGEVRLVGFSFGSLVGRGLAHALGERCRLLVQVAPPNRGAAWARRMSGARGLLRSVGDLVPGSAALAALPVPACPIAIVCGTAQVSLRAPITWPVAVGNRLLKLDEPGDGTVTLAESELPHGQPIDRVLLPYAHDHLPYVPELHAQVAHLLRHGKFLLRGSR